MRYAAAYLHFIISFALLGSLSPQRSGRVHPCSWHFRGQQHAFRAYLELYCGHYGGQSGSQVYVDSFVSRTL
ncbi:hypothetical protein V1520DRAFT_86724 [Lipomyces starkeyi]